MPGRSTKQIARIGRSAERLVNRHLLGLMPNPDCWPEPHDVAALRVPEGIDHGNVMSSAWSLGHEHSTRWPRRRTVIGAQAYRFERNEEYDCGRRLVDVAARFLLRRLSNRRIDVVALIPAPPVYARVPVLEWLGRQLAARLNAGFHPSLIGAVAPLGTHADLELYLPVPLGELYRVDASTPIRGKTVMVLDWRWHRGQTMRTVAAMLRKGGADIVGFTWLV